MKAATLIILSSFALTGLTACSNESGQPPAQPAQHLQQSMEKAKAVEGTVIDKAASDRAAIDGPGK